MNLLELVLVFWLALSSPISVRVHPHATFAPATLRVMVHVDRMDESRSLAVLLEGPDFSQRSDRELEGAKAPMFFEFRFIDVPVGAYEVIAIVKLSTGKEHSARTSCEVI